MAVNLSALCLALFLPAVALASGLAECERDFARYHAAVDEAGARPAHPRTVDGFPHLRVDRFLASYAGEAMSDDARRAWLQELTERARAARRVERLMLPQVVADALPDETRLEHCTALLAEHDFDSPARWEALQKAARVPDDYVDAWRVLGLYPLSALGLRLAIRNLHRDTLATFRQPLGSLPVDGRLRRYLPPDGLPFSGPLRRSALGAPQPNPVQLQALLLRHAPVWEVDTLGFDDLPGRPYWGGANRPSVDPAEAAVYHYTGYTRFNGEALLQLAYLIWFNARPRDSGLDIRGGPLDGLVWRVTLDRQGRALLYDSIHPCGCYHLWFPGYGLRLRRSAHSLPEPPLAPQAAPVPRRDERLILRVANGTHYLQRVYADLPGTGAGYSLQPYDDLYRIPDVATGGQRSLFRPDGLVAGTERPERWLIWPMGIRAPGAMRERGYQPTAFIGRRHFDDADLIDQLFEPVR